MGTLDLSICGLREIITTKNIVFKLIWLVIFIAGLGATGFWLFLTIKDFEENSRATKVFYEKNRLYNYPTVAFCPNNWLNTSKTSDYDLSPEALEFALSYVYFPSSLSDEIPSFYTLYLKDISPSNRTSDNNGRADFDRFVAERRIENYLDFLTLFFVDESSLFDADFLKYFQISVESRIVANLRGCYSMGFPPIDDSLRTGKQVPIFKLYFPLLTGVTLLTTDNTFFHHALLIDPETKIIREINSEIYIERLKFYHITVRPTKIDNLNLIDRPCRDSSTSVEHSPNVCHSDCIQRNFFLLEDGCLMLGYYVGPQNESTPLCSMKEEKLSWDDERYEKFKLIASSCSDNCPPSCVQFVYDIFVTSRSLTQYEIARAGSADMAIVEIDYDVSKGITVFKEIETYTLETLICNVGGILGLWLGASVFTIIQAILFPLEHVVKNCFKKRKV